MAARRGWAWLVAGLAGGLAVLGGASSASAHSIVRASASEITYTSSDATSLNQLLVDTRGGDVHLRDPTVDGGLDYGSCRPGEVDGNGYVIEAFCPRGSVRLLRVDLGEREDKATIRVPFATQVVGGAGADELVGGDQPDTFVGGEGNDVLDTGAGNDTANGGAGDDRVATGDGDDTVQLGQGLDTADTGPGDDTVQARDGQVDTVVCGDGLDVVDADQLDQVAADAGCEQVRRSNVTPPGGAGVGAEPDKAAPVVRVGASVRQRLTSRGVLKVAVVSSEAGAAAASGFLVVGDRQFALLAPRRSIAVGGGGTTLTVRLSARQRRLVRAALRRGRVVRARLGVVATDAAGNSTQARAPTIRIVR